MYARLGDGTTFRHRDRSPTCPWSVLFILFFQSKIKLKKKPPHKSAFYSPDKTSLQECVCYIIIRGCVTCPLYMYTDRAIHINYTDIVIHLYCRVPPKWSIIPVSELRPPSHILPQHVRSQKKTHVSIFFPFYKLSQGFGV